MRFLIAVEYNSRKGSCCVWRTRRRRTPQCRTGAQLRILIHVLEACSGERAQSRGIFFVRKPHRETWRRLMALIARFTYSCCLLAGGFDFREGSMESRSTSDNVTVSSSTLYTDIAETGTYVTIIVQCVHNRGACPPFLDNKPTEKQDDSETLSLHQAPQRLIDYADNGGYSIESWRLLMVRLWYG